MPYVPHTLVTFLGDLGPLGSPVEEFSFGLRFAEPEAPGYAPALPLQDTADDLYELFFDFIENSDMQFSEIVRTRAVKVAAILANGRYGAVPTIGTGEVGSGGSTIVPFQCSSVVTLKANGLGKGRFGRIFLPPQGYSLETDGQVTAASTTTRLAVIEAFLSSVQARIQSDTSAARLVIASKTGIAGRNRQVQLVRLGRIVDTQRRRRRSLDEAYQELELNA